MAWRHGLLGALVVAVLVFLASAGCGSGEAGGREKQGTGDTAHPVGKVLDDTDEEGRHYREIGAKHAPEVDVVVQPHTGGTWDVRLILRRFRLSPAGGRAEAVAGRGTARLSVDGHRVADLRTPAYRLPAHLVPHGLHHVTVRLYADDGTVWAVDGKAVQSTADITASAQAAGSTPRRPDVAVTAGDGARGARAARTGDSARRRGARDDGLRHRAAGGAGRRAAAAGRHGVRRPAVSGRGSSARTGGRGSPDPGGKAS
ncbi:nuclear transport factor 2 family protein [Streptomyces sp. NPDC028635]|uniref:nuclear transport factor 2 family protein n=1 Tax=Streptomyces sp. NPDC028635 TaxID=3154800 RepID=UPI0033ECE1C8